MVYATQLLQTRFVDPGILNRCLGQVAVLHPRHNHTTGFKFFCRFFLYSHFQLPLHFVSYFHFSCSDFLPVTFKRGLKDGSLLYMSFSHNGLQEVCLIMVFRAEGGTTPPLVRNPRSNSWYCNH